jgi:gliding motility-associated-like protein
LNVAFNDASLTATGSAYSWTLGDGQTSHNQSPVHIYHNPGLYTVGLTIVTPQGCSSRVSVPNAVQVFAVPVANFSMSANNVTDMNPQVTFTDQSKNAVSWYWDFGDQFGNSTSQNPVYTYRDTGVYVVMLITESGGGCADTVYRIVSVDEAFNVYIPNAFTPNGDSDNDGFVAQGTGISAYDMWIYDRWGNMIYHCNSLDAPWNGQINNTGERCMQDVYVYKITVKDNKNMSHEFVGRVTLVQ